ncbi:MAG: hypothetical protein EOO07_11930 [Chitinophagaceae bacterium]|nr:MAG: hypothetical protein EOO07_11930 [Chitinophagaceae bacterium]
MAKFLLKNENIVVDRNYDERKFQIFRILLEPTDPETLVLGSSRVLQIGKDVLSSNSLNLGVSGASLEDLIALADVASSKFNSRQIIIGIDPWLFNSNSYQDRWQSIREEFNNALKKLDAESKLELVEKSSFTNISQLVNYAYTFASIKQIKKDLEKGDIFERTFLSSGHSLESADLVLRDGTRTYSDP